MEDQIIYLVYAVETDSDDLNSHDVWAAADSYDVADKIAKADTADEQIRPNWFIQQFKLNTKSDIE